MAGQRGAPERSDGALAGAVSLSGSDRREAQLGFAETDAVDDEVADAEPEGVAVGVGDGEGEGEAEGVGEGEAVSHAVGEGAVVADAVAVADADEDEDGVGVAQIGWRTALRAAATWL
jgi:hypothetical protein